VSSRSFFRLWKQLPASKCVESRDFIVQRRNKSQMLEPPMPDRKVRGEMYQAGFNSGLYAPIAFSPSYQNEKQSVTARVLKDTPAVDPLAINDYVQFVKSNWKHIFPGIGVVRPMTMENYLKSSNSTPAVKKQILEADKRLKGLGIKTAMIPHDLCYKYTMRKSFVKVEGNLYRSPAEHTFKHKAPRLIQGACPEFVAIEGPFTASIQLAVKRVWNKKFFMYYSCGAKNTELGKYITELMDRQVLEDDVSAFDSSIGPEICKLEYWMFKKFGATPLQAQLFKANNNTHGVTSKGIRYKVPGTRKSGDPWTSLFNSILNGCMHLWAFCRLRGVTVSQAMDMFRVVVQGDDSVVIHSGSRLPFKAELLRLGFDCECNYKDSLFDVEFCNSIIYKTLDGTYCMGPKVGRVLSKLGYFYNPPVQQHPKSVLRGVACGFKQLSRLIPFMGVLVDDCLSSPKVTPNTSKKHTTGKCRMWMCLVIPYIIYD
jgi:hypothetical protein